MKQFTSLEDVPEMEVLISKAFQFKHQPYSSSIGKNKCLGLIFFNPSLRTRMSTQKAAFNLGMQVIVMNVGSDGWKLELEDGTIMNGDTQEHIKDAVQVMSSYCDILGVRTFPNLNDQKEDYQEKILNNFIQYSSCPIISLESATLHPLQSLADIMSIKESGIKKPKVVITWAPHPKALPQAVTNSFLQWIKETDAEVTLTHPKGYELSEEYTSNIAIEYDQDKALENADFVFVKNWSSYHSYGEILSSDSSWMVTDKKMALTNHGKMMHCLPIRRNVVASDNAIDHHSIVLKQANNRQFAAQAVISSILEEINIDPFKNDLHEAVISL